jgi:hypothetical protein
MTIQLGGSIANFPPGFRIDFVPEFAHNCNLKMRFTFNFGFLSFLFCFLFFQTSCENYFQKTDYGLKDYPPIILWAWEREENLEFLDTDKYGVAFLAQTLELKENEVVVRPRRQPLRVKPETKLIAVTRVETGENPALSDKQRDEIVSLILKTLELKGVGAVQIDFDAAVSQRDFYQSLLRDLRGELPENIQLSITALASFCLGDRWLFESPVAEAVPMIFRMGMDDKAVKNYLANGGDFKVKACRQSYGITLDEEIKMNFDKSRRLYVFNPKPWTRSDVLRIEEKFK